MSEWFWPWGVAIGGLVLWALLNLTLVALVFGDYFRQVACDWWRRLRSPRRDGRGKRAPGLVWWSEEVGDCVAIHVGTMQDYYDWLDVRRAAVVAELDAGAAVSEAERIMRGSNG